MSNLLKAEVYKLFHGKELGICTIAVLIFAILNAALGGYANGKAILTTEGREIFGLIICTLFAVTYVGKDFTSKTVHHALTSGNTRAKVLGSKFITYSIACFILLILNDIFMGFGYGAIYGWGQPFTQEELLFSLMYIIIGIIFDLCILSIPFFICVLIQNNTLTIVVSFGSIGMIVALSQMPWSLIAENMASSQGGFGETVTLIAFIVAAVVLYILSTIIFRKQDIQ